VTTLNSTTPAAVGKVSWTSTAAAAAIGAAGALIINSLIAWVARELLDVPHDFQPLTVPVYATLTVIGAIIGAIGWRLIATRSRRATRLLTVLVPVVLVLSLFPDTVLLITKSQPGTTTAGVLSLMLMHFGVAAAALPAYRRFIPPQS
jgi:uncharacterized protein DUF6069